MNNSPSLELASALADGAALLGTSSPSNPANNLETVLKNRLSTYYNRLSGNELSHRLESSPSLEDLQLLTAREAISVVQRIHRILDLEIDESQPQKEGAPLQAPSIGTRDLAEIRTLLSLTFKWAVEPLFLRISQAWLKADVRGESTPKIIDLTMDAEDYRLLTGLITSLFSLIFPDGDQGRISQTLITTAILSHHVQDILLPSISLGWLPEPQSFGSITPLHEARPLVTRFIRLHCIIHIAPPPLHARKACTQFLTKQGLCEAAFTSDETVSDESKFEQIARTLKDYYQAVFPQVIKLLTSDTQLSYRRAAAFVVYRAIKSEKILMEPREALWSMTVLISNTEPSPVFISKILSPIIPALYESVNGLLISWGKIVDHMEGSNILWGIVEGGKHYDWKFNMEGHFWKSKSDLKQIEDDETEDVDANLFNLFPDPVHFVQLLKQFDRGDIASAIFLKLLENYRDMKGRATEDSMMSIIMQMQKRLSEGTTSNILRKPDQLLSFIFHVLDAASITVQDGGGSTTSSGRAPASPPDDTFEDADSDDEAPDSEVIGPDDELIETAITLLLSILEADDKLTARTHPIFNDIFSKLEPLALKGSSTLRPLAREARLVITARLANTSGSRAIGQDKKGGEDDQEIYQKALKLLQDPILPVRAHGLLLLRQLVSPLTSNGRKVNKALVPSILSIFLQTVQDEDSYMFLNAVQGLAGLADTFGKEIVQGLVNDYAGGLEGLGAGNLTQHDLDIRTRIGEALMHTRVENNGQTSSFAVDMLVPPLFSTVRRSDIPITLRTSSLSLLADCVDTYPLAMLPYAEDLSQAMVDLLQIENVPSRERNLEPNSANNSNEQAPIKRTSRRKTHQTTTLDSDPTSKNSKFPPLRRAAIHFLSLLIKASTKLIYEETSINPTEIFPRAIFRRMSLTLGYISSTDEDNMVRVMARETKENLEELQRAAFGL
ncbi:hypothetical protein BDZ97DRAFT_1900021 [Flammula alnicola]|nr:hypothetical protein BDZ97DRAFT_1900021 [Flammula alnicola]